MAVRLERREFIGGMAALGLSGPAAALAEAVRVGGARILVMDGRLWIQVRVGDQGPFAFVIDTGGSGNLIRTDLAKRLRLKQVGDSVIVGIGGRRSVPVYEGHDVAFGNTKVGSINFWGYGEQIPIHPEAMGTLSSSMLTVADCDLDFERLEWRIYPDGRGERTGFELLPSRITAGSRTGAPAVMVDAAIAGAAYKLHLDTGAPRQILLNPGATKRSGLWNDETPFVPARSYGVGGEGAATRMVRVPELHLGPLRFERALVTLTDPGSYTHIDWDGLLGLELIERMNLSTDHKAGRLWARRNALPARPERYGMTGFWVEEDEGRLLVTALSPHSPGAEAGLRIGDRIIAPSLRELVQKLGGKPGAVIDLPYERDGKPHRRA